MAAPIRFLSGRQQQQKIGIEGNTQNEKVLEVVGQVGIGTTIFSTDVELEVRGDVKVSGVVTAGSIDITGTGGSISATSVTVGAIMPYLKIITISKFYSSSISKL